MIPKKIHYCWFGGNPKPPLTEKCIDSWYKYCPEYDICEWNEDNFEIKKAPLYVQQAYEAQKWAFVTDYVRLWVLTLEGGVYMDTDVELVKPINDFLVHDAFSGFESIDNIPTGIMGCVRKFPLFLEFLHYYDNALFRNSDGTLNTKTNCYIITDICMKYGLVKNNQLQVIKKFVIYPTDVFCPLSHETGILRRTDRTTAIHWFSGSWMDPEQRDMQKRARQLGRIIGINRAWIVLSILDGIRREGLTNYVIAHIFKR